MSVDFNNYRDLPDSVPAVLTLGTRVTGMGDRFFLVGAASFLFSFLAWLNTEKEKGFYIGTVEAVDLEQHRYRITFDKPGMLSICMSIM